MKKLLPLLLFLLALLSPVAMWAQLNEEPVHVNVQMQKRSAKKSQILIQATIATGWHMYSTRLGDGPTSAAIHIEKIQGAHLDGMFLP
ncbi:MAG TPA: thiol:disulfide interchange protein, partial [Bacteroidaceae bacterium]|nr:thiol:disulfide interchange protein [Bacteroidaceae bacterium]